MKTLYKLSMLAASVLLCGIMQAQILSYDFENLNGGDNVAETLGDPWTTWDLNPGSETDARVIEDSINGNHSMKIGFTSDIVLRLGDKTSGAYRVSLDMLIPDNKVGYFNILHDFDGWNSAWALQVHLNQYNNGHGSHLYAGSHYYGFDYVPYNTWNHIEVEIYLDDALACLKINGQVILMWDYTEYTFAKYNCIAAMNFCEVTGEEQYAGYYVDNINFEEIEGPYIHNLVSNDETINERIGPNTIDTISYSLTNEGNTISRSVAWIDFGVGEPGGTPQLMHYDYDPYYNYGNYSNVPYIEIAAWFTYYSYNFSIGTKITKMQYYVPFSQQSDPLGCEGPMTFRIYNYQTGEILAEKVVNEYTAASWLEVEFDNPVPFTGFDLLASVGFQQKANGYPISLDSGPSIWYYGDLIRFNNEEEWYSLNYISTYYGGNDYGNHNIRLVCEGQPVDASWVRPVNENLMNLTYLLPGQTQWYYLMFNSENKTVGDENHATLVVRTNNDVNPELHIPINMIVTDENVAENLSTKYAIYPNPANDVIHIEGDDMNCAVIYNSNGQLVNIVKINDKSINVNDFENGVYYLNIINDRGESAIQKIVVAK